MVDELKKIVLVWIQQGGKNYFHINQIPTVRRRIFFFIVLWKVRVPICILENFNRHYIYTILCYLGTYEYLGSFFLFSLFPVYPN